MPLEQDLLPKLPKNAVIVMDNATFHKRHDTQILIKQAQPLDSPDFNPIEKKSISETWAGPPPAVCYGWGGFCFAATASAVVGTIGRSRDLRGQPMASARRPSLDPRGNNNNRAFRWTRGRMEDLGTLGGTSSRANGVSGDGSVVVGEADDKERIIAPFVGPARTAWRISEPWAGPPPLPSVNADGSVVVGESDDGSDIHAFRWTRAGGMEDIGTLGGDFSGAYGVSADGSVVVGQADDGNNNPRAFRWTRANGMEDLGDLGGDESAANGVSADGSVVVGWADDKNDHDRAFRWTRADGMEDLGDLGGDKSEAEGVSADGSVVVGYAYNKDGHSRAFRWTRARRHGGYRNLGRGHLSCLWRQRRRLRRRRIGARRGRE